MNAAEKYGMPISDEVETRPVGIAAAWYIAVQPISCLAQRERVDLWRKPGCGA